MDFPKRRSRSSAAQDSEDTHLQFTSTVMSTMDSVLEIIGNIYGRAGLETFMSIALLELATAF
jgi:hypothetical protein